jgi:hypothetical protein
VRGRRCCWSLVASRSGAVGSQPLGGRDRSTLWRFIKAGKLSVALDAGRRKQIDTAELVRVRGATINVGRREQRAEWVQRLSPRTANILERIAARSTNPSRCRSTRSP